MLRRNPPHRTASYALWVDSFFAVVLHRREFFILRLLLVRSLVYLAWACTAWHASAT